MRFCWKENYFSTKMILATLFVALTVVSSVLAHALVQIGPFIVPAAVIVYFWTFLLSDLYCEYFGKKESHTLVICSTGCLLMVFVLSKLATLIPSASFSIQEMKELQTVIDSSLRVTMASVVAFFVSQFLDVHIFHAVKTMTNGRARWLRNNLSTMTSQLVDTGIFITIAFWGIVPNIGYLILSQYVVKLGLAILDTPIFYLFTKKVEV